jgi:Transposase IS116/IS110/IS902 family
MTQTKLPPKNPARFKTDLCPRPDDADGANDEAEAVLLGSEDVLDVRADAGPHGIASGDVERHRLAAWLLVLELGVGPALATALVASVADPKAFRSGRNFSAWIGLVPKQYSSGGKDRLGSISKQGDRYLRSLFTAGALAVIRYAKIHGTRHRPWLAALLARRPSKVAAIALANKIARMAWAMMVKGERYKEPAALAA